LGPLPDENIIGKRLGHALSPVLGGNLRLRLDIDKFKGNKFRHLNSRFYTINCLLGTIGAGRADKHFDVSGRINFFDHINRLVTELTLTHPDPYQGLKKGARLFPHWGAEPSNGILLRCN